MRLVTEDPFFFMGMKRYWGNQRLLRENATQRTSCLQGWLQVSYACHFHCTATRFDGGQNNKREAKLKKKKKQQITNKMMTNEFCLFNTKNTG